MGFEPEPSSIGVVRLGWSARAAGPRPMGRFGAIVVADERRDAAGGADSGRVGAVFIGRSGWGVWLLGRDGLSRHRPRSHAANRADAQSARGQHRDGPVPPSRARGLVDALAVSDWLDPGCLHRRTAPVAAGGLQPDPWRHPLARGNTLDDTDPIQASSARFREQGASCCASYRFGFGNRTARGTDRHRWWRPAEPSGTPAGVGRSPPYGRAIHSVHPGQFGRRVNRQSGKRAVFA